MTSEQLRISWVDSLAEVPQAQWDRLAVDGGFYLSHGWLRVQEIGTSSRRSYVLAAHGDRLLGALPVDVVEATTNTNYTFAAVVPDGHDGPTDELMLLGGRAGYAGGLVLNPDLGDAQLAVVVGALVSEAIRLGAELGRAAVFFYLQERFRELLAQTPGADQPLLVRHDATVHLPGSDWTDYLASMPTSRRTKVRREERLFGAAGYTVTVGELTPRLTEAGALLANVQARYGHQADQDEMTEVLAEQIDTLGDHVAFMCADGDRLIGFALGFPFGDTLSMRAGGFDYERLRGVAEYFNLGFYRPIRWGYAHGVRRLHLGIGSLQAKAFRGAQFAPLWVVPVGWSWPDEAAITRANSDRAADPLSW